MNHSRAGSETSVLTTECSRCVADDAASGLEYYRRARGSPVSQIGSTYAASVGEETNWKDVVAAVKKSWEEVKVAGSGVPRNRSPPRRKVKDTTLRPSMVSPPPSQRRPVSPPLPPPPVPTQTVRVSPERPRHRSPSVASSASLGHWDYSTPAVRKKVTHTQDQRQQPINYRSAGYQGTRSGRGVPSRSRSVPQKPTTTSTDGSALQRRVLHLQRTIQMLEDDKSNLFNQQRELSQENDRFRRAIQDRDSKLSKLRNVKQQINTLSTLNKKTSDLHVKRQRALNYLDEDIKSLFTDWVETRHIKPKTTLPRYRKSQRSLWVC
eukprot:TRINITY_DN6994_c0_g1_i1.p1 TRINITY_DN6994_c0_g1~~TRINITY_DN6994_c0_g1_i1.p1  ORF type:complete len:322 (+),score=66.40 TRINITY_DN6994_c0_g1_i1:37-1002(+)